MCAPAPVISTAHFALISQASKMLAAIAPHPAPLQLVD
jgi:hypothetical protein